MSETRAGKGAAQVPKQRQGKARARDPVATTPVTEPTTGAAVEEATVTRWVGWVYFAAIVMTVIGAFEIVAGLTAIWNSGYYAVRAQDLLVKVDFTVWGWVHLGLGAIAVGAALGLMAGKAWAKIVAIAMAMVSTVVNLGFLAAYPIWSVMAITLAVLSIYAIAVHGDEVTAPEA